MAYLTARVSRSEALPLGAAAMVWCAAHPYTRARGDSRACPLRLSPSYASGRCERSLRSMANRRHAVVLLVLCAVMWSTGRLLVKWMAWPARLAGVRSAITPHRPAALPAGVAPRLVVVAPEWRPGGCRLDAGLCRRHHAHHGRECHLSGVYRSALCRAAERLRSASPSAGAIG